jgi:hypothetical protein
MNRRTLKIFIMMLAVYGLLAIPAYWGLAFLAETSAFLVMIPYLSLHLFNKLGIPGLLEHGGRCGWGWCAPTMFGAVFVIAFWLGIAWLLAWGLGWLISVSSKRTHFGPHRNRLQL